MLRSGSTLSLPLQSLLLLGVAVDVLLCPATHALPAVLLRCLALQVIVGVNKYAQHDEEGSSGGGDGSQAHELDVRKIDNTAVLRTQKERLQVSFAAASGAHIWCC